MDVTTQTIHSEADSQRGIPSVYILLFFLEPTKNASDFCSRHLEIQRPFLWISCYI